MKYHPNNASQNDMPVDLQFSGKRLQPNRFNREYIKVKLM
jgi:hypothetical protein